MKTSQNLPNLKRSCLLKAILLACPIAVFCIAYAPGALAQRAVIRQGHIDIGVAFEDGVLEPHIHDESQDVEYAPNAAVIHVGPESIATIPTDSRFSFLGIAGRPLYLLPQVQRENLPFLGLAADEIGAGLFTENQLRMKLTAASGPGHFFLFSSGGVLATPTVRYDSSNGIGEDDVAIILAGGHTDYSWAFTQPGDYVLTLQATGVLSGSNTPVVSEALNFHFQVIPEPSIWALVSLGAAMYFACRQRFHHS